MRNPSDPAAVIFLDGGTKVLTRGCLTLIKLMKIFYPAPILKPVCLSLEMRKTQGTPKKISDISGLCRFLYL
jgi:hypothetical protein